MTITISLGNLGSGKTATEVKEMYNNWQFHYYSNIDVNLKNAKIISAKDIIIKEVIGTKKSGEEITKYKPNKEYWRKINKPAVIVIDEAHLLLNPRKSMTKINVGVTDWLALLRKIVSDSKFTGRLVLITQLANRLDNIAVQMATRVKWHICHYTKECDNCRTKYYENSDFPKPLMKCPYCESINLTKKGFKVEVWEFPSMNKYKEWQFGFIGVKGNRP
nr:AAA family ATPase [Candidatus Dadabacteria bacterium]